MAIKNIACILALIAWVAGCGGRVNVERNESGLPVAMTTATAGDMMNILEGDAISKPYSRYLYRISNTDGNEVVSGVVSIAQGGDENVKIIVNEKGLEVIPGESFRNLHDIKTKSSDRVPFSGGYVRDNKIVIMPGLYMPVEFHPSWFPSQAALSVNAKGDLLMRLKSNFSNETQRLVAFMDAHRKLKGVKCEILGTFDSVPQLKKLIKALGSKRKSGDCQYYVLRLSWSSTFALVAINSEKDKL